MSDDRRPLSEKSRQELLDEIYLLRDVAGEREQQCASLQAELADRERVIAETRTELGLVYASRSWRLTSPLRAFARWFSRMRRAGTPGARPAVDASAFHPVSPVTGAKDALRDGKFPQVPRPAPPPLLNRRDGTPHLFVDVTELALREGRTGVQRVTREILRVLLASPPAGYVVEPVCAPADQPYRLTLARHSRESGNPVSFDSNTLELPDFRLNEDAGDFSKDLAGPLMDPHPGDVFLGLDHAMQAVIARAGEFAAMHERGVRIWFVCNDVLPLSHPEWFPPEVHVAFKAWLEVIARVADGIACISQATLDELKKQLDLLNVPRDKPLALAHFHLGADLATIGDDVATISPEQASVIECLRGMNAFLMVGTLEPRKGHAQALQAFEILWADGSEVALVIAGFPGWMTDVLARRIRHHDEFGKRLFWFMGPDDAVLDRLYSTCTALLAPSEGEGFGLPLVEAARHGLPILCRDLPVFREVAGEHATYFSGLDADSLAIAIQNWLGVYRRGGVVSSKDIRALTWVQSAQGLADIVLHGRVGVVVANR